MPRDDGDAIKCANALKNGLDRHYGGQARLATIPDRLSPKPKVVEVWLPPRQPVDKNQPTASDGKPDAH